MNKLPILFSTCIAVKGYNRSIICDLQRNNFELIPNDLYNILINDFGKINIDEIKVKYNNSYDDVIDEYLNFLIDKEYMFFTNSPHNFPKLDYEWDEPSLVSNAIIDLKTNINLKFLEKVIDNFEDIGCKHVQIRIFNKVSYKHIIDILNKFNLRKILSIELMIVYSIEFKNDKLFELISTFPRIKTLYLHNYKKENMILNKSENGMGNIMFIKNWINTNLHCGKISSLYFVNNIKTFTEAQKHNTCLNRKISIDTEGYIRNCPSMKEHYGNIKDTTLQEALEHPDFKKYWFINKDQISVCKDCEFRYICTDCRAYIEDPKDILSKPLKCGYNPYTCEWEEWSTNPLKQKAIDHYGMRELVKSE